MEAHNALHALRAAVAAPTTTTHDAPQIPAAPAAGFTIHQWQRDALRAAMTAGIPTLMAGPAGTGKTETVAAVCHAEQRALHIVDCGGIRDPLDWFGSFGLSNGRTQWIDSATITAMQTPGAVILLDEVNRASTIAQNTLLPLLDSRRRIELQQRAPVALAEGVWIVATANEGAEYAAAGAIDLALRSRLAVRVECGYMTAAAEAAMLAARFGISRADADTIAKIAAHTRRPDFRQAHQWSLDTRAACAVARMLAALRAIGANASATHWQVAALSHCSDDASMGTSSRSALAQVLATHGIG